MYAGTVTESLGDFDSLRPPFPPFSVSLFFAVVLLLVPLFDFFRLPRLAPKVLWRSFGLRRYFSYGLVIPLPL